jgi:hypothetical protein
MRQLAVALIVLAAVVFLVGVYSTLFNTILFARGPSWFWKGAIAFLGFAIAVLQLHAAPKG